MNRNIFKLSNWSKLDKTIEQRGNVLLSLFSVIAMFVSVIQITIDTINEVYWGVFMDCVILATVICTYFLNENRKHILSKILFVGLLNTIVFAYANIIPKETGTYFYFFPVIAIASLVFESKNWVVKNIFIGLPIVAIATLELSNFQLFGNINIQEGIDDPYSFPANMFISIALTALSMYQMMSINRQIDVRRINIADELKSKNDDLRKINTELDHFVYSTSHDLKAPLSSISGLINIAKLEVKEEQALEYFEMIDGRVDKLNAFIKDIIDLSRNSRLDVVHKNVDIAQLIDNVLENNRFMVNAQSINFTKNIATKTVLRLDKARVEVVLNNLISNAIKYHKKEGDKWVKISVFKMPFSLKFQVEDNGIGIKKAQQEKIFDMFYRGSDQSEGSGLGLYIVSDVVSKMQGKVAITSEQGVGTKISFTIPTS